MLFAVSVLLTSAVEYYSAKQLFERTIAHWEPVLTESLIQEGSLDIYRYLGILSSSVGFPVELNDSNGRKYQHSARTTEKCLFNFSRELQNSGLTFGTTNVCVSASNFAKRVAGSRFGLFFLLLQVLLLGGTYFFSLANYRKILFDLIVQLEKATEMNHPLTDSGNDELQRKIFSLISQNIKMEIFVKQQEFEIERERDISRLANQVAHDIRSPVLALRIAAHSLQNLPPESRYMITSSIERISRIADDLLDQNKSSTTVPKPSPDHTTTKTALRPIVDSILFERRLILSQNSAQILFEVHIENDIYAPVNSDAFERVLTNLLTNAEESIPENGRIAIAARNHPNHIEMTISDDGQGIPEELIRQLGTQKISSGKTKGNGIGVLTAFKYLESIGGTIFYRSIVGQGTVVTLTLPKITPDSPSPDRPLNSTPSRCPRSLGSKSMPSSRP